MSEQFQDEVCLGLEDGCEVSAMSERCVACRAYADELAMSAPQPLPSTLGARLRAMSEDFADADPLYIRALAGEPLGDDVPPGEAENPGRRAAHDALAVTFAEARRRRQMPPALEAKLRVVPRRHMAARLPLWLVDSRWATAASLVLTATLALLADDVSARFQQTANALTDPPPMVQQIETPDWPARQAELERLIEGARQATGERLGSAGEVATNEAQGWVEGISSWSTKRKHRILETTQTTWEFVRDRAAKRFDAAAKTLEETKIGQFVADLMQQGENNE